jgi:tetratricopeptide (TPR) repeat protein/predicted Ser/Thr protein kinase
MPVIGQTVSHYKIVGKIGEGGMGVVFKAEDTRLDRVVALKFLPRELDADDDTRTRFIHEAKSASSLDHPNICTIHEIDETEDGRTFIVMPHYEGESLKERIKNGPLEIAEAIDIVVQVASGLAKAHEKGIVHRDIKPANIIVTNDEQVKLVDFGVAKLAGQTTVTKTGRRVGTVGYMSPQQALGEPLDARSDVFSLGVVLYELIAGCLPFRGDVEAAMLYAIVHEDPKPLSAHRDDIPEALEQIIDKALRKEASDRYADAAEFMEVLESLREELALGQPLRMGRPRRARRIKPRGRVVTLVIAALVILAVVGVTWLWQHRFFSPSEALALAVVDFRDLETPEDPTTSAGMTGLVHVGLVESSPIRVISPEYLHDLRRRLFDSARGPIEADQALEVARAAGAALLLSGQMGTLGAVSYVTWQLVDVASGESLGARRVQGDSQVLLADQVIAEVLPLLAEEGGVEAPVSQPSVSTLTTSSPEAYRHYVAGVLAREERRSGDALRELKEAVRLDSTFALALFELSRTQHADLERDAALRYAELAWESRTRVGVKDRMRLEAWWHLKSDRASDAIATYKETLQRWPDDQDVLRDLSRVFHYEWHYGELVDVAGHGLQLYPDDYVLGGLYATALSFTARPEEALVAARRFTTQSAENPNVWDDLGLMCLAAGMPDSAEVAFRQALEVDPDFLGSQVGLGQSAYCRGDVDRAIEILEGVLARPDLSSAQRVRILTHVSFWPGLALCHAEAGQFQRAFERFDEARRKVSGPESRPAADARVHLLLRLGRADEALRRARTLLEWPSTRFDELSARRYVTRSLVALDSLEAAREAAAELTAVVKEGGSSEPFLLLRVAADIALAEGDATSALEALEEMSRYGVPLGGLKDIERRESLARAFRMTGRLEDSASVLEELLRIYGSHALARYQLGQIYEQMGRARDAEREYTVFLDAWSKGDEGLPQVVDARERLDALRGQR